MRFLFVPLPTDPDRPDEANERSRAGTIDAGNASMFL